MMMFSPLVLAIIDMDPAVTTDWITHLHFDAQVIWQLSLDIGLSNIGISTDIGSQLVTADGIELLPEFGFEIISVAIITQCLCCRNK